ncbi:MAG: hypothetical protein H0X27_02015 [Caulobacteraceae bacterium]|nr:hypothetical protein [Caulobacteraceae bacterium]
MRPADIRSFAIAALAEPIDEALLRIAICEENDTKCIKAAADHLFKTKGFSSLATQDILKVYAADVAVLIVQGDLSAEDGADLISRATERFDLKDFHDLDTFRYASSEMPDRPEDKAIFEQGIMEEAAFLARRRQDLRSIKLL